jgi:Xaa-Pro aminopeptidase
MINMWKDQQIKSHLKTAKKLDQIMQSVFEFIAENKLNISERQVQEFIINEFKKNHLSSDKDRPIVAYGANTANVHYFPGENSAKLEPESLIMIDIWARDSTPGSPFADITWMGYYGHNPSDEIVKAFNHVILARDRVVHLIKQMLKHGILISGKDADSAAREFLAQRNLDQLFLHTTGHPLGFYSAHGKSGGRLKQRNLKPLQNMVGYTIEPGVYFKEKFGFRTEIDFYITVENKMVVTTKIQKELIIK